MIKKILWLFAVLLGFIWFSFATKYELNQPTALYNLWTDAIFTFTNWANFNINSQYFVYQIKGSYNNRWTLFWANTWLYTLYTQNSDTAYLKQWYLQRFCRTTYNNHCNWSTQAIWINIDEFLSNSSYTNPDYFDVYDTNTFAFCFWYEDLNESICFLMNDSSSNDFSQFKYSLWFTKNPFLSTFDTYPELTSKFTTSPFSGSPKPVIPPYERGEGTYTNQDIIDWYNAMWLSDWFCYWWFPIDDMFNSSENPDSRVWYKWGTGASILDIWDNYKTAYNNDYISFLRTFYVAYENKNYNAFYWYPKSLYSFFNQWSVIDLSSVWFNSYMSDFTITNIWEYCNLKFNSNPNATYTWNSWKPWFAFDNQDVVNNKWRFDFSWNSLYFSGSLSWFNSASDFFGSLNSIFQNWLGWFNDIKEPLLPSYIIIFMLAIIFIRIISH